MHHKTLNLIGVILLLLPPCKKRELRGLGVAATAVLERGACGKDVAQWPVIVMTTASSPFICFRSSSLLFRMDDMG